MKVTEEDMIPFDDGIDMLDALINDRDRPTKYSRDRIEEWLKYKPEQLRAVLETMRKKMEAEVYHEYKEAAGL